MRSHSGHNFIVLYLWILTLCFILKYCLSPCLWLHGKVVDMFTLDYVKVKTSKWACLARQS